MNCDWWLVIYVNCVICNLCFVDGVPDKKDLEKLFLYAAPRLRLLREKLRMDPDLYEDVDFFDFVVEMQRLVEDDKPFIQQWFPSLEYDNVLDAVMFDEEVREDHPLPALKKKVEDVLVKDKQCAISIMFNEHIVTGLFDAKVQFHECNNTLNLLMHLLMCFFCQAKKAYLIDSNFSEFWQLGKQNLTFVMRPTRATAEAFGSRLVMDIKKLNNVENFMLGLYWWISCRWSDNSERNQLIRCCIWGVENIVN